MPPENEDKAAELNCKKNHLWIDLLLAASFLAAFYLVTSRVSASVRRSPQFRFVPDSVDISFESLPEPISLSVQESIKDAVHKVRGFNPLYPNQISKVKNALLSSPWVKNIEEAKVSVTGVVTFCVEVRKPLAWVLQRDFWYLCDSEGVRLPVSLSSSSECFPLLPIVCGLSNTDRLPRVGERWRSGVLEAVSIAELLTVSQERGAIPALAWQIDISHLIPDGKVVIVSDDGRRFEWGRSPLSTRPDLLSNKEKLDNLTFLLKSEDVVGKRSYYLLWTVPTAGPRMKEVPAVPAATQKQETVTGNSSRWRQF